MFSPANTSEHCRPTPTRACTSVPPRRTSTRVTCSASSWSNDGNQTVAIMNLNDAYGNGLAETARRRSPSPVARSSFQQSYDPAATSFDSEVDAIVAADPDAIVVIGFNESSKILRAMVEKGIGPRTRPCTAPMATSATHSVSTSTPATDHDPTADADDLNTKGPGRRPGLLRVRGPSCSATASAVGDGLSASGEGAEVELDHLRVGEQFATRAGVGVRPWSST